MKKITTTLAILFVSLTILFAGHGWKRVNYTNSTIFTGIVTVDNEPANEGDVIGVFVNGECRMIAEVFVRSETAFVSSVLHGESVEDAVVKYWSVEDDKVYDVEGTFKTSPSGEISLYEINVVTNKPAVTAISSLAGKGEISIKVYPIPLKDELFVESSEDIKSVEVNNNIGQKVIGSQEIASTKFIIGTSDFDPGIYFLTIEFVDGTITTKRIVKNIKK